MLIIGRSSHNKVQKISDHFCQNQHKIFSPDLLYFTMLFILACQLHSVHQNYLYKEMNIHKQMFYDTNFNKLLKTDVVYDRLNQYFFSENISFETLMSNSLKFN